MAPGQPQQLNIDISKYIEQKENGTARIIKVNGITHYALRRFDSDSGAPTSMLAPIDAAAVQAEKEKLLAIVAALEAVAADIAAAKEV